MSAKCLGHCIAFLFVVRRARCYGGAKSVKRQQMQKEQPTTLRKARNFDLIKQHRLDPVHVEVESMYRHSHSIQMEDSRVD